LTNVEVYQAKNAEVRQAKLVKFLYLYKNNLEKSEKKLGIKNLTTKVRQAKLVKFLYLFFHKNVPKYPEKPLASKEPLSI